MKFGVATFFTGQGIGPAALAQALEERGFDSLFVTEHTHIPALWRTPYLPVANCGHCGLHRCDVNGVARCRA